MFLCEACCPEKDRPQFELNFFRSRGRCEKCGLTRDCADIHPKPETVPCTICGKETAMTGTKLCDGCWEVQARIDDYIRHPNGAKDIITRLVKMRLLKKNDTK